MPCGCVRDSALDTIGARGMRVVEDMGPSLPEDSGAVQWLMSRCDALLCPVTQRPSSHVARVYVYMVQGTCAECQPLSTLRRWPSHKSFPHKPGHTSSVLERALLSPDFPHSLLLVQRPPAVAQTSPVQCLSLLPHSLPHSVPSSVQRCNPLLQVLRLQAAKHRRGYRRRCRRGCRREHRPGCTVGETEEAEKAGTAEEWSIAEVWSSAEV